MNITITDAAKDQFRQLAREALYPRLVLTKAGCCSYKFIVYPDKEKNADTLTCVEGATIIIDPRLKDFPGQMTIDYGRTGLRKDFIVKAR